MKIFNKSVLKNGLRIVTEHHPNSRAVAMSLFVDVGTRDEKESEIGISHLLEHLVFKGTKKRSAFQIAKSLESLGGDLNAYTTRENTCYHALVLKENWEEALDVLSDLVQNMKVSNKNFKLEKSVILQELATSEENPEEWIYDLFFKNVYPEHGLGRSILGQIGTIARMSSVQVVEHYKEYYSGPRLILAVAGHLDHNLIVKAAEKKFKHLPSHSPQLKRNLPNWSAKRICINKKTEQVHLLMGWPTCSFYDKERFCAFIINALLGGGMTSRLFQSVREKRGLVYTIHSSLQTFSDSGVLSIYAAADRAQIEEVVQLVHHEMIKLKKMKITQHDLNLFKTQIRGSLILGSDDMENRMTSIAVNEMIFGKYKTPEEIIQEVEKITLKDLKNFLKNSLPLNEMACVLLGPQVKDLEVKIKRMKF